MHKDKRFYNRVTIAALNYEILQMTLIPLYMELKLLNPFLNSRNSANHNTVQRLSSNDGILIN